MAGSFQAENGRERLGFRSRRSRKKLGHAKVHDDNTGSINPIFVKKTRAQQKGAGQIGWEMLQLSRRKGQALSSSVVMFQKSSNQPLRRAQRTVSR